MDWRVVFWFLAAGVVLTTMGTMGKLLQRWWLTTSMLYLALGIGVGPLGIGLLTLNLIDDAKFLEHLTEVAVIISLFGAGIKMRMLPLSKGWVAPLILAFATMLLTVGLTTAIGWLALGLPLGAAVLLGAVLAPTDPVLAAEVQVEHPDDKDRLRLMLTGEAGFNDGTAFPMVVLGVGLVGIYAGEDLHALGAYGWKFFVIDVLWRILGGLAIGYGGGWLVGQGVLWIRKRVPHDIGADEMLTLGFIALIYGAALAAYTYAFLAVFAAAVASRQIELRDNANKSAKDAIAEAEKAEVEHEADAPEHAAAMLARSGTLIAETLEKLVEVTLVVLTGSLITAAVVREPRVLWFVPLMLFVVRPLAVYATLWRCEVTPKQRGMTAWFGLRGIGTLYYLTHAFGFGVADALGADARLLADLCLGTIAASVILHGFSVTPLMHWYQRHRGRAEDVVEEEAQEQVIPAAT